MIFVNNNAGSKDYNYDAGGNLSMDANKSIDHITYNEQDLPLEVESATGRVLNIYGAGGQLLQKTVYTNTTTGLTPDVYRYWGPFVYKNNVLQYALHNEGRARWDKDESPFIFDYFVRDHLGNVRTVVSSETMPVKDYRATHELASAGVEDNIFDIPIRVNKPGATAGDQTAVELNGNDPAKSIGISVLLKVMAGDQFKTEVSAFYEGQTFNPNEEYANNNSIVNSLITTLTGGITDLGAESGGSEIIQKCSAPMSF